MLDEAVAREAPATAKGVLGTGYNVLPTADTVTGHVRAVRTPKEVIALMKSVDTLRDTVVLTRGGAVTFAGPLLTKKPAGVITIEGSPESHLGILSREFTVPAVMSIELVDTSVPRMSPEGIVRDEYVEHVITTLAGRRVQLDCSDPTKARVLTTGESGADETSPL